MQEDGGDGESEPDMASPAVPKTPLSAGPVVTSSPLTTTPHGTGRVGAQYGVSTEATQSREQVFTCVFSWDKKTVTKNVCRPEFFCTCIYMYTCTLQ